MPSIFSEQAICGNCKYAQSITPEKTFETKLDQMFDRHNYVCTRTNDFRLRPHNTRCDVIFPGTDLLTFTHK